MQIVKIPVRHFGETVQATLRVEGAEAKAVTVPAGAADFEVAVPAVGTDTAVEATVEVAGKVLASQRVQLKPVRKWVVYLLPHSHVDIGYTHVQTDVERAQWKYLEMAMDAARQTADYPPGARFKWNVEVLWAVDSYLQQATPEKRQQFIEAVKSGEVGLQALYGNELTGLCSSEELLRLLSCAQRISRLCDTPISSAMITDVPGYTWGIVPAFAHSGVKYFSIGPNGGDRIGHTAAAWGDKPFWWIGPNGKDRVLVWMTGTGYYRVFSSTDNLLQYLERLEQQGYPYDMVQVRHCLGDNGAPDVDFSDTVKAWNDQYAYPKLVIATTDEMFRDFEQRYGEQIPDAQGRFHAVLGRRSRIECVGNGDESRLGRPPDSGRNTVRHVLSESLSRPRFLSGVAQRAAVRRAHLGSVQQHQPTGRAVRKEPVGDQATVRGRCGRAISATTSHGRCQPWTRRAAGIRPTAGRGRNQHHILQLPLYPGGRATGTLSGRRCRQRWSGQQY